MKLELTEQQYRTLLEMVYMGNWMATATKIPSEQDGNYEEMEQYIYRCSKEFNVDNMVEHDEQFGEYHPTQELEEKMQKLINEYDGDTFWQELSGRLARRDLFREIGPVSKLTEKHIDRQFEIEEVYSEEFEKNSLENLEIKK